MRNWRLLVVSDDEEHLSLTRSLLCATPGLACHIDWARGKTEGEKAIQAGYDAVIVSAQLDGGRGAAFIRQFSGGAPPLLLLSDQGSYEEDQQAMHNGAAAYLMRAELTAPLLERTIRYAVSLKKQAPAQQRISEALSGMTDAYVAFDADWRYLEINRTAEEEFLQGRSSADVLGKRVWDLYPELVGDHYHQMFQEAMRTGEPRHFEAHSALNDKWYEVHCYPYPDRLDVYHRNVTERRRAEQERERLLNQIQTDQARLEAVLQALPVGVWISDASGKVFGKNTQADHIWAGDVPLPEQVSGYGVYEAWWSDSGRRVQPEEMPLAVALATRQPVLNQVIDIHRFDGTYGTVLISAAPIFDEHGEMIGGVVVNQDITLQRGMEKTLKEQTQALEIQTQILEEQKFILEEQKYTLQLQKRELERINQQLQGLFEHAPAGLAMFSAEPPYMVLACNQVYQQIWSEPFHSYGLVGHYLTDFIPQAEELGVMDVFREVTKTGRGKTLYHYPFDGTPGGRTWWDWDLSPIFEDGVLTAFVLAAVDVTSEVKARKRLEQELMVRQRFEEALWASENRLRRLIDSNIIGIAYTTVEGRVTDANDAFLQMVGYSREDLVAGQINWRTMTPEEMTPLDEKGIAEANERGACTPYEKEYIRKDGGRVPVLIGYALFEGSTREFICFLLDLTEQKQAEEQVHHYAAELERSNRDLQDFAFIASHDLQEPLRKIIAFGSRLSEKTQGQIDEEALDYLARMQRAARRMQHMIEDLLTYSRVATRGQPFVPLDLQALANEVIVDLEMRIEQTGGKVEVGALPIIEGDARQMQHLLQNLISNALKFHRPNVPPLVNISGCQADQEWAELTIADNGIGFSEEHAERIFQPFLRLHGRSEYEGSGMGLAICRKIVERHGGQIHAHGEPGSGSRFVIRLPIKHSPKEPVQ